MRQTAQAAGSRQFEQRLRWPQRGEAHPEDETNTVGKNRRERFLTLLATARRANGRKAIHTLPGIKSSRDPMPKAWGFCYVGFGIQEKAFCCAEGFFYVCNLVIT
ncbi:Uncharacterised protein [Yersinia frederiksenii]|nr:Uncharacterised protein [Yersinia frederiksenii]